MSEVRRGTRREARAGSKAISAEAGMSGARVAAGRTASDQDALSQRSTELVNRGVRW